MVRQHADLLYGPYSGFEEYYWETHRILVETSTERAETQFYMLFELLEYIDYYRYNLV